MREIRSYGSVRGAAGNGGPYRDKIERGLGGFLRTFGFLLSGFF
jgi:hypothetical protein